MSTVRQPLGPFETRGDATDAAAGLHVELDLLDISGRTPNQVRMMQRAARRRYITKHLRAARVDLGSYDKAIVAWLASVSRESPEALVTILGWVLRSKGVKR